MSTELQSPRPPLPRMSAEEFLLWSESQAGRCELVDGIVYAQAAERAAHAGMKPAVAMALADEINKKRGLDRHALVDGMAVKVGARTAFEADAMVYCLPKLPPEALLVENPVIVVEGISPTPGRNDHTRKAAGYLATPSVRHSLIVDPGDRLVVRHERGEDDVVRSHFLTEGDVPLDPLGPELALEPLYPAA